ncbi:hypothetical protein ABGV42_01445 [Paenibacillus pabuli]|uniref:hypothetical protein n=1 Tax=Paenibacillus pabuli TaxID=1472 RepID=UPI003241C5DE
MNYTIGDSGDKVFNPLYSQDGDVVTYFESFGVVGTGVVKGNEPYAEGVFVYGEGWSQFANKFFIIKVERGNEVIFQQEWYNEVQ